MKKRIYIDMDGVLCDFKFSYDRGLLEEPSQPYPQSRVGFFYDLQPIPGALEAFRTLSLHYDVWILTRPSTKNLHCYTEKALWVKKYLGETALNKLILCTDKSLLKGDFLIDDTPQKFGGQIILFNDTIWSDIVKFCMDLLDPIPVVESTISYEYIRNTY